MSRCLPALLLLLTSPGFLTAAHGQSQAAIRYAPGLRGAAVGGRVHGTVTDQAGKTLGGVNILAMGTTLAAVRSDGEGRFVLPLPPGEYVLRAVREGYLSSFRELVRIFSNEPVEKNVRMFLGGIGQSADMTRGAEVSTEGTTGDHTHSDTAWQLRHLSRTVLRDAVMSARTTATVPEVWRSALGDDADAAQSFLARWAFDGQVNLLTRSSRSASGLNPPQDWPDGIAYVSLGAPVGAHGDWSVRASMSSGSSGTFGNLPAWTLVGEYQSVDESAHAFRLGVSHAAQRILAGPEIPVAGSIPESRGVSGLYGSDRWQIRPELQVEYGFRFDHYNYLDDAGVVSPRVGVRLRAAPRSYVTASASQRVTAPGADQFLPLSSSHLWLPPERTFSSLDAGASLHPERVRHYEVGFEYELGGAGRSSIHVRRFSQSTINQLVTVFGLDGASEVGHYRVGTLGNVLIDGWAVGLSGGFLRYARASADYTTALANWHGTRGNVVRRFVPSAARRGSERVHDVTGSIEVVVPETSTRIDLAYRLSNGFSSPVRAMRERIDAGRFNIGLRQQLPYQPFRGGTFNLLLAIETLVHDSIYTGSLYDELLTVAPPTRFTGGLQVWF